MKTLRVHRSIILLTVLAALLLGGCASTSSVQYGDPGAVETLTNEFGSTDLQMIAEKMAGSLLNTPMMASGGRPLVTLAPVKNKTSEYIDTKSVTEKIRVTLLKSGRVRFAVDTDGMQNQVDETVRQTQTGMYRRGKSIRAGRMHGAQYRIEGTFSSITKQAGRVKDVYYSFRLELIDNETGIYEWAEEKEIRKTSERPVF